MNVFSTGISYTSVVGILSQVCDAHERTDNCCLHAGNVGLSCFSVISSFLSIVLKPGPDSIPLLMKTKVAFQTGMSNVDSRNPQDEGVVSPDFPREYLRELHNNFVGDCNHDS